MKTRAFVLFSVLAVAALFSGCANPNMVRVKPWERATLAGYTMRPDRGRDLIGQCLS